MNRLTVWFWRSYDRKLARTVSVYNRLYEHAVTSDDIRLCNKWYQYKMKSLKNWMRRRVGILNAIGKVNAYVRGCFS